MSARLHALLIGIDYYYPPTDPDVRPISCLRGCVNDIALVDEFLRTKLRVPPDRIETLTATNRSPEPPPEPEDRIPTYANLVAAFRRTRARMKRGDQIYIHYAGHGGRVPTRFPDIKGEGGLDETLIPSDVRLPGAQHLRDIELAHLIREMVDDDLLVTIVLDSCHSGGATRSAGAEETDGYNGVRGIGTSDLTPFPATSLVAGEEELRATWRALTKPATRSVTVDAGWLPEPDGYVLLSACRASELAREIPVGDVRHGALTYFWLEALDRLGAGASYKALHDRIIGKVHGTYPDQTPQLQGEGSRVAFGTGRVTSHFTVSVVRTDDDGRTAVLNAGEAHGVCEGATFEIHAPGADLARGESRASVTIDSVSAVTSTGRVAWTASDNVTASGDAVAGTVEAVVESGAPALLTDPGPNAPVRGVAIDRDGAHPVLDDLEAHLREGAGGILDYDDSPHADFRVAVRPDGAIELRDADGTPVPNTGAPASAATIAERLAHVARWRNVRDLACRDARSPLAGTLTVELTGVQRDYEPGTPPKPEPFANASEPPVLRAGDWTFLRIRNDFKEALNVTVLDLSCTWAITQIFPGRNDSAFHPLDPGRDLLLPLQAGLPDGGAEGFDVVKVFATVGPTGFRWLELPPVNEPPATDSQDHGESASPDFSSPRPAYRSEIADGWTTGQVEIRVRDDRDHGRESRDA